VRLGIETKMKLAQTILSELANGGLTVAPASWSAPAEHSGDGAFAQQDAFENFWASRQSGVALRLPAQSKIASTSSDVAGEQTTPRRFSRAGRKAAEGCRSPKPRGISGEASGLPVETR
jgi:hypothetical protein